MLAALRREGCSWEVIYFLLTLMTLFERNERGKEGEMRWGILGTGGIAQQFAADLSYTDHHVEAVGSRHLTSAEKFPVGNKRYGSYEELVLDENIDAVYVASLHPYHRDNALLALNAGKPVLVEKPFAMNTRQVKEMLELAQTKSLLIAEAMWTRFLPHVREVRKIISSGALGEIISFHADHGQDISRQRAQRLWDPAMGGGALLDLGVYPIAFAQMIFGKPEKIVSQATLTDEKVDLHTSALFHYSNGAQATMSCTMAARTANKALISGSKGRIEIEGFFFAPSSFKVISGDDVTEYPNQYPGHGLREQALSFEKALKEGKKELDELTHAESIAIMETMDEIRRQCGVRYSAD